MTKAAGYTRLSEDGLSIPKQKEKIRDYCDHRDLSLVEIYDDGEYASGYETDERPEYRKLRSLVQDGEIGAVVVRDTSRIGRDFNERLRFVLDCRERGIELHSDEHGKHDISNPFSMLQETAQAAGDDVQKRKEIERSQEATEERIEQGCYHGTPPFGLRFAEDKCHLERDPEEWHDLREIIDRRPEDNVSDVAEDVGLSPSTVSRIANRGLDWYEDRLERYG